MTLRRSLAVFLGLAAANGAHAIAVPITNPGFEGPATPADSFITNAPPTGWTTFGSINFANRVVGVLNPATTTLYADPVPEGANVGVVFLSNGATGIEGGLQQTLAATLQPFTHYTLQVEVGNLANDVDAPHNSFQFNGFPGYRVDLLAGGTVLVSDTNSLTPAEGRFLRSTLTLSIGASHALAGQALGIRLVNLDAAAGIEVNFDDVRLDATAIPEPAGGAAVAAVLALLAGANRRSRGAKRTNG